MHRPIRRPIALLSLSLLFSAFVWVQNTSELQGRVLDNSGHPVVSAFVIITGQYKTLIRDDTKDD